MVGVKGRMKFDKESTPEDKTNHRKNRDNINKKIKYWRSHYNFDLYHEDYEDFNKIAKKIAKIKNCIDEFLNFDPNDRTDLVFYGQNKFAYDLCLPHYDYIKSLKRLEKI